MMEVHCGLAYHLSMTPSSHPQELAPIHNTYGPDSSREPNLNRQSAATCHRLLHTTPQKGMSTQPGMNPLAETSMHRTTETITHA